MPEYGDSSNKPPYTSWNTLVNFLNELQAHMLPSRIDKSLMPTQSGANQSNILSALRFFDLVDNEGVPSDSLGPVVDSVGDEERFQKVWSPIFTRSYKPVIGDLDLERATTGQLQDCFREYGFQGETLRKCHAFFNAAADAAGENLAPHIRKIGRAPRKKRAARSVQKQQDAAESSLQTVANPDQEEKSLRLDPAGKRIFSIKSPAVLSSKELNRIKVWLEVQLIVDDDLLEMEKEESEQESLF